MGRELDINKNIMHKYLVGLLLLIAGQSRAQSDTTGVVVKQDSRIEQLVRKQIEINAQTTLETRRHVPGFRIQVISSPDRNKVNAAKVKMYEQFPDWKPYVLYQAPNYKLRVGDFLTEDEADSARETSQYEWTTGRNSSRRPAT